MSEHSKQYSVLISIVIATVLAVFFGAFFPAQAARFGFLGDLFLNALKMMVLPLIVTSMIVGVTNMGDVHRLGTMGVRTLAYYLVTTGIAVIVGILLVDFIRPGEGFGIFVGELPERIREKGTYSVLDVLMGLVHPNLVEAASEFRILPLILASILFGIAFTAIGPKGQPWITLIGSLNDAVMKIVHWIILLTPIGVFGLISERIAEAGGGEALLQMLAQLGKYCGTVVLGLMIHGMILLPLFYWFVTGKNPFVYFVQLGKALLTAFSTASSSATLPVTMECVTEEAGVSQKSAGFVLPIGATVNMDGTALYEAVAAIFIAQCYGVALGFPEQVIIFLTATLAAIGAAGIPEAGLVTMVLVLQAVGLPLEGIGIILAIDWLLDRCRTSVNVWGDAIGAAVIEKWESGK